MSSILRSWSSNGEVSLKLKDAANMEAVLAGTHWFGVDPDGTEVYHPKTKPLPLAVDDEQLLPFWSNLGTHIKAVDFCHKLGAWSSPHFDLAHLCAYNYTPENYAKEAAKLESWGFFCMRSKRGPDGKYWEVWRLNGDWDAEGELKEFFGSNAYKQHKAAEAKTKVTVTWLCQHCSFGTLDVSIQRACMVID